MRDQTPNWQIWLNMPSVSDSDAIALTYNLDPRAPALKRSKPDGYRDRLMLCRAVLGAKVTPARLSEWAQSKPVDWDIPIELAALAPVEAPTQEAAPADAVRAALEAIAMPGSDLDEVRREFELAGARFVMGDSGPVIWTSDGMTKGQSRPLSNPGALRWAVRSFALDRLLRGSGASGGGAMQSHQRAWVAPPESAEPTKPEPAALVAETPQQRRDRTTPGDDSWGELARAEAGRIIKRQADRDLYPSQQSIADEIAADFRKRKPPIVGADGKPLAGSTIKRHALNGISSATKKAQSTSIKRGK